MKKFAWLKATVMDTAGKKKEFQVNKLFYVLCRVNTTFKDCLKYDNVDSDN